MKPKLLLACFCLFFGVSLKAQTWTRTLSSTNPENEVGILEASDASGSLINVSNIIRNGQSDIMVTRLTSAGVITWTRTYSINNGSETAQHFILDRDNNVVIVGSVVLSGTQKGFVLKVGFTSGSILFGRVSRSTHASAMFRKVIQMNSGYSNDYVVLGTVNYPNTNIVARIGNSTGATVWSHNHNVSLGNTDLMYTLSQINSNRIIIGGHFYTGSHNDHGVIQLDPGTGARIRQQTYNIANGTANNGGFDDAVVIPGTDSVIFSMVVNGGGATSRHGFAVYNGATNTLSLARLSRLGASPTRAPRITFNTSSRLILMAGLSGASLNNNFLHCINANTFNTKWSSTYGSGVNRSLFNLNAFWVSVISTSELALGNTLDPISSTDNDILIAKYGITDPYDCFDSILITDTTLTVPSPATPTIDSTNEIIDTASFILDSLVLNDTLRCESSQEFVMQKLKPYFISNPEEGNGSGFTVYPYPYEYIQRKDILRLNVYPNPLNGNTHAEVDITNISGLPTTISVYDINGRLISSSKFTDRQIHWNLDAAELSHGIYIIKAENQHFSDQKKLVVN